ncbi:MAG TPA: MmgE/PrpD family protein [Gammaproteobacteria bacterium]
MAAVDPAARPAAPLARRLAAAAAGLKYEQLSVDVAEQAKLCVLDLFSSAFAARELPWGREAVAVARAASGGTGTASIFGTPDVATPADAAFANAVLGHGLVRDDMHLGSVSHLGTVLVPALLALLPASRASGKDFVAALAAGYEIGGKVGRMILDVDVARTFRPTGIAGPLAAAAAGARLLGASEEQAAAALALAANTVAGYNEWAATGGSEMFFHVGFAARNAVTAVQLAMAGAYASPTALDGEAGLLAAFRKPREPAVPAPFADRPEILAVFFKPVPACNYAQAAAQAAHALATAHGPLAEGVERIVVRVPYAAAHYPGCDCAGPFERILQAKMSIQYNVAAALARGDFAERNYEPSRNPDVLRLAALARLEVDDALTRAYPAKQGAEVIVSLADGRTLAHRVDAIVAASAADVRARFDAAATAALGAERAAALRRFVEAIEHAPQAHELASLVRSA